MTKLYDYLGRSVSTAALGKTVIKPTTQSSWESTLVASLTPAKLAEVLKNSTEGDEIAYLTLAEEMEEADAHYAAVVSTRKLALLSLGRSVEPASSDKRDVALADEVRELCVAPAFDEAVQGLMDAIGKGYALVEISWQQTAQRWWPLRYQWRDPRLFKYSTEKEAFFIRGAEPDQDKPIPPYKFICHQARLKTGTPIRGGLARFVAWMFLVKRYGVKDWVAFCEIYGLPLRVGRYGPEATEEDIKTLVRAVSHLGADAAAVIPESMRVEFQQAASGKSELFENLVRWCDEQISKAVLGQTMTSDDGSSLSQAQVHNEVRHDLLRADAKRLASTLNQQWLRPYIDLNYGQQAKYPRLSFVIPEAYDSQALANALQALVPLGLNVDQAVVRERLGLPDPQPNAQLLEPASPTALNHSNLGVLPPNLQENFSVRGSAQQDDRESSCSVVKAELCSKGASVRGSAPNNPDRGFSPCTPDCPQEKPAGKGAFNKTNPLDHRAMAYGQTRGVGRLHPPTGIVKGEALDARQSEPLTESLNSAEVVDELDALVADGWSSEGWLAPLLAMADGVLSYAELQAKLAEALPDNNQLAKALAEALFKARSGGYANT